MNHTNQMLNIVKTESKIKFEAYRGQNRQPINSGPFLCLAIAQQPGRVGVGNREDFWRNFINFIIEMKNLPICTQLCSTYAKQSAFISEAGSDG